MAFDSVAQSVEQQTFNLWVLGSIPSAVKYNPFPSTFPHPENQSRDRQGATGA